MRAGGEGMERIIGAREGGGSPWEHPLRNYNYNMQWYTPRADKNGRLE